MAAADALSEALTVTVMLSEEQDALPRWDAIYPVLKGSVRRVTGHLGSFEIVADGVAEVLSGGRGGFSFQAPKDGGRSQCDVIVDFSGNAPLVPAHGKRDGYLRADPSDPAAVADVLRQAVGFVGTFENRYTLIFTRNFAPILAPASKGVRAASTFARPGRSFLMVKRSRSIRWSVRDVADALRFVLQEPPNTRCLAPPIPGCACRPCWMFMRKRVAKTHKC